jgi:hypothetical protein
MSVPSKGTILETPPPFFMRMGCTDAVISYRAAGNEGVCLQAPERGMQVLANFNAANGDIIGVDDTLERTLAHANLSDVANYITSQVSSAGTTLYFDATGTGKTGTPIALLQGVTTSVAELVADGGMKYVPDQVVITPQFNTPLSLRPDGLETVVLQRPVTGIAAKQLNGFNAALGDKLELVHVLNSTLATTNLSNIASYIHVTASGGNTTLSFDKTGTGQTGTAFAVLNGVSTTLNQLLAEHALMYDPIGVTMNVLPSTPFIYRAFGSETAILHDVHSTMAAGQLSGFSLAAGDGVDVSNILSHAGITADLSNIQDFFSTVATGNDTQLWFDPNGSGHGGIMEADFHNASFTMTDLLAHSALHLS